MYLNYLEQIHSKGYLILNEKDFNFSNLSVIHDIFDDVRLNEESRINTVRVHGNGRVPIKTNQDLDTIIETEYPNNQKGKWFQIWKFTHPTAEENSEIKKYLQEIVNTIYGESSIYTQTEYTCFRKGCAIRPHIDKSEDSPQRICAILSYFSEPWDENWGGNLIIDGKYHVVPNKGTIVILDFTKNNILHEVNEVLVDKNRLSLTTFVDKI